MTVPVRSGALRDELVTLPGGGPELALRRAAGSRRPFLLVHGLASNARMWDGVATRMAAAGHEVAAVDLRGHGRSEQAAGGYDTATAAADLAALIGLLGWTGRRTPLVAGQSWGANVVVNLAAEYGGVAGIALVDGGWIRLADRFPDFAACWAALAPPSFEGVRWVDLQARFQAAAADWPPEGVAGALANFRVLSDGTVRARLARDHHREIVRSLFETDPRAWPGRIDVPALLLVAVGAGPDATDKRAAVGEALAGLPDSHVRWYVGAHHDLHAQQPERTAADLLTLADRAEQSA